MVRCTIKLWLMMTLLAVGAFAAAPIDIPYKKFVLDNGLTVIVSEDHKAPIVAVNVWYHVGSKNEKPGKTGFAHLFEHLMFNGSEHFKGDYWQTLEKVGGTDMNGTTAEDRTNYFQNVPTTALDMTLWFESDRMGHMLGAINQASLDEQRGVVQNEKRQGDNRPYAKGYELMSKTCFPAGHPYSWQVIGSLEDLEAARLGDVQEWFKSYYGPANAVLSIAGDVDTSAVLAKVKANFGSIPSGPPVARYSAWIAKRSGTIRQRIQDRVPQTRITMVWNVPQWGTLDAARLDMAANVLGTGHSSRLYKRLVLKDQTVTGVSAYNDAMEIAGLFMITANVKEGVDPARVEKAIDEEMAEFLKSGPTEKELERERSRERANFIRGIERIGGFGGKSDKLAECETYAGNPEFYKTYFEWLAKMTAGDVREASRQWLSDGVYVQQTDPFPKYRATKSDVDRTTVPLAAEPADARFPGLARATLSSGLKVILAERHAVPIVQMQMMFDGGTVVDPTDLPGVARMTSYMLDEGTKSRKSEEISEELALLGAGFGSSAEPDYMRASISMLKENIDPTLELYADLILNPAFRAEDFQRCKKQLLSDVKQEKARPDAEGYRIAPRLMYGAGHPYGALVTEASIEKIGRDDLIAYHRESFKPGSATLIVVGDTTMAEITPKLEKAFKQWEGGTAPKKQAVAANGANGPAIYLIDKPQAPSSFILVGNLIAPENNPEEVAIQSMHEVIGGQFTSRINMNLREGKHWSYGAFTGFMDARAQRMFVAKTTVQTDKTSDSMVELMKELKDIRQSRPITEEEFAKVRTNKVRELGGTWETMGTVQSFISRAVNIGLPDDYYQKYPGMIREVTIERVRRAASDVIQPDKLVWVVVGDRAKIEKGLRALSEMGYGEVRVIDADGNRQ
ncbi:insulinase family protein [bacterium]|nr:insulinase family protein [bacterium]